MRLQYGAQVDYRALHEQIFGHAPSCEDEEDEDFLPSPTGLGLSSPNSNPET